MASSSSSKREREQDVLQNDAKRTREKAVALKDVEYIGGGSQPCARVSEVAPDVEADYVFDGKLFAQKRRLSHMQAASDNDNLLLFVFSALDSNDGFRHRAKALTERIELLTQLNFSPLFSLPANAYTLKAIGSLGACGALADLSGEIARLFGVANAQQSQSTAFPLFGVFALDRQRVIRYATISPLLTVRDAEQHAELARADIAHLVDHVLPNLK
jgi:hypothetical protein